MCLTWAIPVYVENNWIKLSVSWEDTVNSEIIAYIYNGEFWNGDDIDSFIFADIWKVSHNKTRKFLNASSYYCDYKTVALFTIIKTSQ